MLRRIKLIVTGDVERRALPGSLRRWFPANVDKIAVQWLPPRKVHCTTSNPLAPPTRSLPSQMEKLVRAMVAEVWEGSDGQPADLVIAVDDLELANQHQPAIVVEHIKAAMHVEIERRRPKLLSDVELNELRRRVQNCCSFHLLAPMIESYFFADRAAE